MPNLNPLNHQTTLNSSRIVNPLDNLEANDSIAQQLVVFDIHQTTSFSPKKRSLKPISQKPLVLPRKIRDSSSSFKAKNMQLPVMKNAGLSPHHERA